LFQFLGDSESSRLTFFHQPSIFQEQRAKLGNRLGKGNMHQSFSTSCIYYSDGEKREKIERDSCKSWEDRKDFGIKLIP